MPKKTKPPALSDQIRAAILADGRPLLTIAQAAELDYAAVHKFAHAKKGLSVESLDKVAAALRLRVVQDPEA